MEIDDKLVGKFVSNSYTGCWEWVKGKNKAGYGVLHSDGKLVNAHRYSWLVKNGTIPNKMEVCHKCDNPSCINPDHLFLGTHADNMQDAYVKGRVSLRVFRSDPAMIATIQAYWRANPNASLRQAAQACKCSPTTAGKYKP